MNELPPLADVLGWAAAALTLLAFSCNNLLRLRCAALAANAAFISYGITAQLWPVVALHCVLVPVNAWRLWQAGASEVHGCRPAPIASEAGRASP
jgi:predicted Abi (CAAX) family protease